MLQHVLGAGCSNIRSHYLNINQTVLPNWNLIGQGCTGHTFCEDSTAFASDSLSVKSQYTNIYWIWFRVYLILEINSIFILFARERNWIETHHNLVKNRGTRFYLVCSVYSVSHQLVCSACPVCSVFCVCFVCVACCVCFEFSICFI